MRCDHVLGSVCDEQGSENVPGHSAPTLVLIPIPASTSVPGPEKEQAGEDEAHLCGIPRMTFSIPISLDLSMMVLRAGIMTSQPSRPKRFSEDHFRARKSSNLRG